MKFYGYKKCSTCSGALGKLFGESNTVTRRTTRPGNNLAKPRRTVSTSGSSGMLQPKERFFSAQTDTADYLAAIRDLVEEHVDNFGYICERRAL